jgi:hypothetical protein
VQVELVHGESLSMKDQIQCALLFENQFMLLS